MAKKGKSKISKVKRNNQTTNKMTKQGKNKTTRHKQRQPQKQRPQAEPEYSEESEHSDDMVDEDDLEYLRRQVSKNHALLSSVPQDNETTDMKQSKPPQKKRKRKASDSDTEQLEDDYVDKEAEERSAKKVKPLLPIKTKQGIVERSVETDASSSEDEPQEHEPPPPPKEDQSGSDSDTSEQQTDPLEDKQVLSAADLLVARRQELREKKFKIGTLCSGLLESPEKKLRNFFPLYALIDERQKDDTVNMVTVRKLATLSVYEVFKDILPEYQFKHQDYSNVKLKKDTLSLYKYEKELLDFYKRFLQKLEKAANVLRKKKGDRRTVDEPTHKLGLISLQSLCGLLIARPNFNFAVNICQTVVPFLNNRDAEARKAVNECCRTIFSEDKKGEISLMLVRRISHLVKSRSNNVHPDALTCLLALRIKDVDLDAEKTLELKQKKEEKHKKRLINMSKKERKRNKKLKEVEHELLETQAEESKMTKQKNLTEITKTIFLIYFRILKNSPHSKLLSATLEGLSKFAHVINLDYYSDMVNIMNHLLSGDVIGPRQRLHCIQTVFRILSGQGDALNIDPTKLYAYLYEAMLTIHAGRTHEDLPIILDTMDSILVKRRRKISQQILLAYVKRLGTLALQVQHNGALGCLAVIKTAAQNSKAVDPLLQLDESIGSGRYDAELLEPEYCGANATALYECAKLRRHYHPTVRRLAEHVANSGDTLPPDLAKLSPDQFFKQYNGSQMAFKPSIPVPQKTQPKKRVAYTHTFTVPAFEEYCESRLNSVNSDFSQFLNAITVK